MGAVPDKSNGMPHMQSGTGPVNSPQPHSVKRYSELSVDCYVWHGTESRCGEKPHSMKGHFVLSCQAAIDRKHLQNILQVYTCSSFPCMFSPQEMWSHWNQNIIGKTGKDLYFPPPIFFFIFSSQIGVINASLPGHNKEARNEIKQLIKNCFCLNRKNHIPDNLSELYSQLWKKWKHIHFLYHS